MNIKLKEILLKVNFLHRYKIISDKYNQSSAFQNWDASEVKLIIEKYNYVCSYNKSENFFKVREFSKNKYETGLNISLKYGVVEFILNMDIEGESIGKPFGYICQLIGEKEIIKKPRFGNYIELEEVLKNGFAIYEDIKKELLKL